MRSQKWQNDLCSFPSKPFNITAIQVYCPNCQCQRSWNLTILWCPTRPYRTSTKKKKSCLFHHRGLEYKSRKSRVTWSNSQVWSWSIKWSRAKDNRVLPREHTAHSKHPFQTTQAMTLHRDITKWSILKSDWYILCNKKWRSSIQSAQTTPTSDYCSDYQLPIAKFRLKLKKVGKTTRPFKCNLNQVHYDYTVEVTNRFKRLNVVGRVSEELWTEVCNIVEEVVTKIIPKKRKEAKCFSEAFKIARKRKVKSKGERLSFTQLNPSSRECQGDIRKPS